MTTTSQYTTHEQRIYERYRYKAPVKISKRNSDKIYQARTYNYSLNGLCLLTRSPVAPGSEIYVRMVNHSSDSPEYYHTIVKWCRKIKKPGAYYGIGTQYAKEGSTQVFGFDNTLYGEFHAKNYIIEGGVS